jgi:hypothetical protein
LTVGVPAPARFEQPPLTVPNALLALLPKPPLIALANPEAVLFSPLRIEA